jgi:quinol monooxygenase YgiN
MRDTSMALLVRTIYRVKPSERSSFLADFSVIAQTINASPACECVFIVDQEVTAEGPIESISYWTSEAGFDDHLRWRLETTRWKDLENRYLVSDPEIHLNPVIFRY